MALAHNTLPPHTNRGCFLRVWLGREAILWPLPGELGKVHICRTRHLNRGVTSNILSFLFSFPNYEYVYLDLVCPCQCFFPSSVTTSLFMECLKGAVAQTQFMYEKRLWKESGKERKREREGEISVQGSGIVIGSTTWVGYYLTIIH